MLKTGLKIYNKLMGEDIQKCMNDEQYTQLKTLLL